MRGESYVTSISSSERSIVAIINYKTVVFNRVLLLQMEENIITIQFIKKLAGFDGNSWSVILES